MRLNRFKGTGVALVTPFHKDGSIDFKSFKRLIDRCISGKVDYLVPLGTTGESVTLTAAERRVVMDFVVEVTEGRVPVMMGLGGNNTIELVRSLEEFDFTHIDAVLSVTPYYNKPSQQGLIQHYTTFSSECPVPVFLYNVPSRTGCNMDADTILEIAASCKNVVGIKEASGSIEKAVTLLSKRPKDFLVISGDDLLALPTIACGGDGVVSVIANAYPKEFSEMVRLCLAGEFEKARRHQYRLHELTEAIFAEGNPSGIKALLDLQGVCREFVRMPLAPVSRQLYKRLESLS
ncbi:MAG: 4-hydroxy-tetrahydrodipicolinate synthase [Bacteroidota bacterium]